MIAPVRARVLAWLAAHEQGVLEDIARDVTARTADVRYELRKLTDTGLVVAAPRAAYFGDRATVYRTATVGQDGPGRADTDLRGALAVLSGRTEPTHCDQIISLLADGTVWSSHELHRRVLCILHSRVAQLRKKLRPHGFDIEHSGGGAGADEHFYRLVRVAPLREPTAAVAGRTCAVGSLSGVGSEHPDGSPPGGTAAVAAQQLSVWDALAA